MVQLHSRPVDEEQLYHNLTAGCDCLGPLDHLMISSDHPLQKIKDKQELQKRLAGKGNKSSLRTSRSTGVIHQRSSTAANNGGSLEHSNLESNHYCCTNISTGLSETTTHNGSHLLSSNNTSNEFALSHLSNPVIVSRFGSLNYHPLGSATSQLQKCLSCSANHSTGNFTNSNLTCTCSSSMKSGEPIYMLPSLKEQTEALSLEYPSNVVAINTDQVQFTRMSSFRRSLIHVGILNGAFGSSLSVLLSSPPFNSSSRFFELFAASSF